MSQAALKPLLKLDDWRVRQHFKRVEAVLRAADVSHLPGPLRRSREQHLNRLYAYAARGVFPRNDARPGCVPCFVDRDGRECAVAHLVMASGHAGLALEIAARANNAYVAEMNFSELDDWAAQSGLSKAELALIQPGYYLTMTGDLLTPALTIWAAGMIVLLANVGQLIRRRKGIVMPVIGLISTGILVLIGIICLDNAATAYYVGTHPDSAPAFRTLGLDNSYPLALGGLFSLGLAFLTGWISSFRLHDFKHPD